MILLQWVAPPSMFMPPPQCPTVAACEKLQSDMDAIPIALLACAALIIVPCVVLIIIMEVRKRRKENR